MRFVVRLALFDEATVNLAHFRAAGRRASTPEASTTLRAVRLYFRERGDGMVPSRKSLVFALAQCTALKKFRVKKGCLARNRDSVALICTCCKLLGYSVVNLMMAHAVDASCQLFENLKVLTVCVGARIIAGVRDVIESAHARREAQAKDAIGASATERAKGNKGRLTKSLVVDPHCCAVA